MNKVFLTGRVTADVELRQTQSGTPVSTFTLAVDRWEEGADFINIVAWKKLAELASRYVKKGDKITIFGRIQTRNYEKDGKKVYITEVIADEIEFAAKKKEETKTEPTYAEKYAENVNFETLGEGDELPF